MLTKEGEIKGLKSGAERRAISIDESTAVHFRMWHERQREELTKLAIKLGDATSAYCSERGK